MKSFHFSLGNSTNGPIGFCARVEAENIEQATTMLKNAIEWFNSEVEIHKATGLKGEFKGIDYLTVYFNPDKITWQDVDDEEEIPREAT